MLQLEGVTLVYSSHTSINLVKTEKTECFLPLKIWLESLKHLREARGVSELNYSIEAKSEHGGMAQDSVGGEGEFKTVIS